MTWLQKKLQTRVAVDKLYIGFPKRSYWKAFTSKTAKKTPCSMVAG
ncbi:hypothetical protein [Paraflavitalea speifideaquila]|nr:hypothetical protein [Paraflavitalea speifideiaquila]